ncbi:MAG: M48 family metallopeptidase, partial [Pseudomonadota bacterium]
LAPFRGELHRLVARDKGRSVRLAADLETPEIRVPGAPETFAKKTAAFFKAAARTDLSDRVAVHAQTLGVEPTSIAIKDTRSRWGSCSAEGRLNFSWRLVCAPPFVLDYVAAHEVAHLVEMNHSDRFWTQVAHCIPDVKPARVWLRENGAALHTVGAG